MRAPRRSIVENTSGTVAFEFAVLSPLLIFLILSVIQMGINYMETSAVQSGAFLLARAVQTKATQPSDAASAKAIVLSANMMTQQSKDLIVSVSPLPTTALTAMPAQPTADSFALPGAASAVLIRVVAARTSLLPLQLVAPTFWSNLVGTKIDYSVVAVTPNA
jgi:Flp pilus assembly protein TadG